MVKGNIHHREIVHESPSVELGLYTIRLSVKCYKINEKIYNHIKKSEHSVLVHQLKEGLFVESIPSSSCVCIEFTTNLLTLGINKHSVQ